MRSVRYVAALCVVLVGSFVTSAHASPSVTPNAFASLAACNAAMESGQFRYYEPRYYGLNGTNPVNNVDRIRVALESSQCVQMLVVGGVQYVPQREGTYFRAYRRPDGSLQLYARDDCGNPVYGVTIPAPAPAPMPTPTITAEPERVPPLTRAHAQPPIVTEAPRPARKRLSQWGLTASGTLGQIDSRPIRGALESFTNRTVCMQGRNIDIGLAHGSTTSSIFRFTVSRTTIADDSFTRSSCPSCGIEIETTARSNVAIWGAKIGADLRIPMGAQTAIAPMVSVSAGVGRITGDARQQLTRGTIVTTAKNVTAREMMGTATLPMGGVGVGVMGALGHRVSYAATLIGIEYPGRYYGRVALTLWF